MFRRSCFNAAAVLLAVLAGAAQGEIPTGNEAPLGQSAVKPITGVDRSYMDLSVSPCKDFYAYANGAFDKVPIPGEYAAYGVNQEIDERNFAILKEILETFGADRRAQGERRPARRRLLRLRHGRGGDRPRRIAAAGAVVGPHSGDRQPQGTGCGHRPVAGPGPERRLPLRRGDRRQGHHDDDRGLQPRRPRPAGARLLFPRGEKCGGDPRRLRGAHRPHARTGRRHARGGQGGGRFHHGLGNQAGEGLADAGGPPRPGEELQQVPAGRA